MQTANEGFANLVKSRRRQRKLSLRDLEKLSGVSYRTIARLESAEFTPTLDNAERLAIALDFTLDDVIASSQKPAAPPIENLGQLTFLTQVTFKLQHINSGRRKNLAKTSLAYQHVVLTSGVLLLKIGAAPRQKITAGTRLNCSVLRDQTTWALAMTDADLFWIGRARAYLEPDASYGGDWVKTEA